VDYKFNFEKLEIWNLAIELALTVYNLPKNSQKMKNTESPCK
jgi:hypothetical protein